MKPSDLTKEIQTSPVVAFHQFVLLKRKFGQDLFCFFEGKDDPKYYYERIKSNSKVNHHSIICGNKKSLIYTYDEINKRSDYSKFKKAFFMDLDFDSKNTNNDIYETPHYSIENFYVDESVLSDILKNEFGLQETSSEYKEIMELFAKEQAKYNECSLLFNSWYATLKKKCNNKGINPDVNLNEQIPKNLVLLKIGNISCNYTLKDIENAFPNVIKIDEKDINEKINDFNKKDLKKVLRGKYQIEFLYRFLQYLIIDANLPENRKILKNKTKFRIDKALILSQLSKYAETPDCLVDYIKRFN